MQSINSHCKLFVLGLTALVGAALFTPTQAADSAAPTSLTPFTDAVRSAGRYFTRGEGIAVGCVLAAFIRLKTKPMQDYKLEDWRADCAALLECWKLYDFATYQTLIALFDKWIIGRKFALVDIEREFEEDGIMVTIEDKKIKSTPFGLLGLFDAYVIQQFKDLAAIGKDFSTISGALNFSAFV